MIRWHSFSSSSRLFILTLVKRRQSISIWNVLVCLPPSQKCLRLRFCLQKTAVEAERLRWQAAAVQRRRRCDRFWNKLCLHTCSQTSKTLYLSAFSNFVLRGDHEARHVQRPCPHRDLSRHVRRTQFTGGQDLHRPLHLWGSQRGCPGVCQGNRSFLCQNRGSHWIRYRFSVYARVGLSPKLPCFPLMRAVVTRNCKYSKVNESTVPHFCVNEEDLEAAFFSLWSQEKCFIHAENFHRNKLKVSSCVLFGYLSSQCKNAVWCLENGGRWMWNESQSISDFFFFLSSISCSKKMETVKKMETREKNLDL